MRFFKMIVLVVSLVFVSVACGDGGLKHLFVQQEVVTHVATPTPELEELSSNVGDTYKIASIIPIGKVVQRIEYEEYPVKNCDNKDSVVYEIKRSRTLEESTEIEIEAGVERDLSLGGGIIPAEIEFILEVGAGYGWRNGETKSDSNGLAFTVSPGRYPIYTVAWREAWEEGVVTIDRMDGKEIEIPYKYMKSARSELFSVLYEDCESLNLEP